MILWWNTSISYQIYKNRHRICTGWHLLGAQRPTLVPGFILIDCRGNMGDILDVILCAAAICQQQGQENSSASCQSERFNLIFPSQTVTITPLKIGTHSLSAYSPHSLRCGSGLGAALCLPSWRHTPSERVPPISAAAKYAQTNSRGREVTPISAATNRSGERVQHIGQRQSTYSTLLPAYLAHT